MAAAREKRLSAAVTWRRLLHFRRGWFSDHSEADGRQIFLSPKGDEDASAELEATVRGFFSPATAQQDEHPLCRFPARATWLSSQLGIDARRLPRVTCPGFEAYWKKVSPRSVTLVFSSYYLNNPSSVFGHTFLRLNKPGVPSQERQVLLDQGLDYSATVPSTENAILYAIKGLTGLYPGTFRLLPYYYKVREYNDFESRDLWEYELDLPRQEVELVAAHLWELGHTYFDYYYLTENCSYHVLAALEVANPKYELLRHVSRPLVPVTPADTVKALFETPGLVHAIRYRPSIRASFHARVAGLSGDALAHVSALASDPEHALPKDLSEADVAAIFDAATDLVELRYAKELTDEREGRGATLKQRLLERRAELGITSDDVTFTPPVDDMPQRGHGTSRLALSMGASTVGRGFYQLEHRVALHDLADRSAGYAEYAQLEFLPFRLRFGAETQRLRLEDLSLVRILSLNPVSRFDLKPSWKIEVGATTYRDKGCEQCTLGLVKFGSGFAANAGPMTAFATADLAFSGPRFSGDGKAVRFTVGPSAGVRLRVAKNLLWLTKGSWGVLPFQSTPRTTWEATSAVRWSYAQNFAAGIEGRAQPEAQEAMVSTYVYF